MPAPVGVRGDGGPVRGRGFPGLPQLPGLRDSGKSIYAVAKATGLNEDSLSRFLRGDQGLRLDKAGVLADYLGLELRRQAGQEGE
jgi:hypothetical protein